MEETKPLVSFIVPVYNVPVEMLRECIGSILSLTLRPFEREIIIVDDGSDVCPIIEMPDLAEDIIYIRQSNAGVSVARNRGLKMASGRFIQFIDADDMLHRAPYEHVLDILRYQECDMVMFDFTKKRECSLLYEDSGPVSGAELMRRENVHGSVCCYAFCRSMLGSLRFTPGVRGRGVHTPAAAACRVCLPYYCPGLLLPRAPLLGYLFNGP